MDIEKVLKISVGGNLVGMVGLEEIFSRAGTKQGWSGVELERFLLDEAKKKNFIRPRLRGNITQGFAGRV